MCACVWGMCEVCDISVWCVVCVRNRGEPSCCPSGLLRALSPHCPGDRALPGAPGPGAGSDQQLPRGRSTAWGWGARGRSVSAARSWALSLSGRSPWAPTASLTALRGGHPCGSRRSLAWPGVPLPGHLCPTPLLGRHGQSTCGHPGRDIPWPGLCRAAPTWSRASAGQEERTVRCVVLKTLHGK